MTAWIRTFLLWLDGRRDGRVPAGQFGPLGFKLTFNPRSRVSLVHLTGFHSFQRTLGRRLRPHAAVERTEEEEEEEQKGGDGEEEDKEEKEEQFKRKEKRKKN